VGRLLRKNARGLAGEKTGAVSRKEGRRGRHKRKKVILPRVFVGMGDIKAINMGVKDVPRGFDTKKEEGSLANPESARLVGCWWAHFIKGKDAEPGEEEGTKKSRRRMGISMDGLMVRDRQGKIPSTNGRWHKAPDLQRGERRD